MFVDSDTKRHVQNIQTTDVQIVFSDSGYFYSAEPTTTVDPGKELASSTAV